MLAKSRAEKRTAREAKLEGGEVFMPDDRSMAESTSTWGVVNIDSVDSADPTEDLRVPSSKLPWAISMLPNLQRNAFIKNFSSLRKWWFDHQLYCSLS
jgi:hypothetical protein